MFGVYRVHGDVLCGDVLVIYLIGYLEALEDSVWGGAVADGAWRTVLFVHIVGGP